MIRHPGQSLSIYGIAVCVSVVFDRALRPENIKSDFKKCGIFPFDDQIFIDDDVLMCSVTDRPLNIELNNEDQTEIQDLPENQSILLRENIMSEHKTPLKDEQSGSSKVNNIRDVVVVPPPPQKHFQFISIT